MDIRENYVFQNQLDNFGQYKTPKQYQETFGHIVKKPKKPNDKRLTFIDDMQKLSKATPGVGKYPINPQKQQKSKKKPKKIDFNKLQKEGTHTYVDDLIKKKKQMPLVGKYQLIKDDNQQIRKKYRARGEQMRKKSPQFRPTVMQEMNVDTKRVSPGQFQVLKPLGYKSIGGSISPDNKKNSQSLPKLPSSFDYNPIPVSYETFSRKASGPNLSKVKASTFGTRKSLQIRQRSPGPKYSLIATWFQKKNKNGDLIGSNAFKSTSNLRQNGIYN